MYLCRKEDIYSEASKALREIPKFDSSANSAGINNGKGKNHSKLMPAFTDMVQYVQEKAAERVKTNKKYVTGNSVLAFNPAMYGEVGPATLSTAFCSTANPILSN